MDDLFRVGPRLPKVARKAIQSFLGGDGFGVFEPDGPPAAVFVTLRSEGGRLRGCVGALTPSRGDIVSETARSAVLAATRDPRFSPVLLAELAHLGIEVSVLSPEEPVAEMTLLDPSRYGVIVRDPEGRQGVLLPNIDGIDDAALQVRLAREKGGIREGTDVTLSRFGVHKWADDAS